MNNRNHADARALLMAAWVIGRRSDEQRKKRTFVTSVLIKVLTNMAKRIDPPS